MTTSVRSGDFLSSFGALSRVIHASTVRGFVPSKGPSKTPPLTIRLASSAHADITKGCGGNVYYVRDVSVKGDQKGKREHLGIQVSGVEIYSIDFLAFDCWVQHMLR